VSVGLRQHGYGGEDADAFIRSVLEDAARRPGVQHVAAASAVPLEGVNALPVSTSLPAAGEFARGPRRGLLQATPGFLDLYGVRVLRGRDFSWSDDDNAPRVALVTEQMARELWPGQEALGQQFVVMFGEPFTVVGVVADAHYTRLTDRQPLIILPLLQTKNMGGMDRLRIVAAGSEAASMVAALRAAVRATDGRLPTFGERSVQQHVEAVTMPQRFGSILLGAFGVVALLIAAVGIYAVASYDVARRHRELGIRAALGAGRRALVQKVLGRAWLAVAAGVAVGAVLAAWATRGVQGLLFGITPGEPVSYVAAATLLVAVAAVASWLPARRAATVDPAQVIRDDG
jgi:putative ABC transport system permease protein